MGPESKGHKAEHEEAPAIRIKVRGMEDGVHPLEIDRSADVLEYPPFSGGTLRVVGTLEKEGERLHLHAKASADGHFECTRCNEPFDRTIKTNLDLEFVPPRLEKDPEDDDVHVYDPFASPFIDITADVRDALALAIPMKHLHKPDCLGLCPTCGRNMNTDACDCPQPHEVSTAWSALKGLQERLRAEESKGMGRSE